MKKIILGVFILGLGLVSCKKEDSNENVESNSDNNSGLVIAQDADAALTIGTVEQVFDENFGFNFIISQNTFFKERNVFTGIDGAESVTINGKAGTKVEDENIGTTYVYNSSSDFNPIEVMDTNTWVVKSNGNFWVEDFTFSIPNVTPSEFGIIAQPQIDFTTDYNIALDLSQSVGFAADTLLMAMSDSLGSVIYKQVPASAKSANFSPDEMSKLQGNQIFIQLNAVKLVKRVFNDKNIYFTHQRGLIVLRNRK